MEFPNIYKGLYYFCSLKDNDGDERTVQIHRALANAFIPNPENKPQINHIDGNKLNNDLSNLEWVTAKENTYHAYKMGLRKNSPHSENGYSAILKNEDVIRIRELYKTKTAKEIVELFPNVGASCIYSIVNGYTWKHIK